MNIQDYQLWTRETAMYSWPIYYPALELAGEVGEVCNQIKKIHRDDGGVVTPERKAALSKELGDVCWALCRLVDDLNLDITDVLQYNYVKLTARVKAGTIKGSGDNR